MTKPFQPTQVKQAAPHILKGELVVFFAFEVGKSIALKQVSALMQSQAKKLLRQKKQTPRHIQYANKPQVIYLDSHTITCQGFPQLKGEIWATVFDFGAVSIAYHWPIGENAKQNACPLALTQLPDLSEKLYDLDLEKHAKLQMDALFNIIQPAIVQANLSTMLEDYYVFVIEQLNSAASAEHLLNQYPDVLSQTLQFETKALSQMQQNKILSKPISYYPTDLFLVDWNASLIVDPDYMDTLSVLELLNVELLEARFMDAKLDEKIQNYDGNSFRHQWYLPLFSPYRAIIEELASFKIDAALLEERLDNTLKLIGDVYLSRVYEAASQQFYLPSWDASISRKLTIIDNLYTVLTDRIRNTQSLLLELIIVILISAEIILTVLSTGFGLGGFMR
ncbi:MAG: hypothetical protein AAGI66_03425 [Cyanobacteria bacterium P01_H01_bin.74]